MSVRVRFAPSPTGRLHIGALRDALHKFLLARHTGGVNILRIEDTDRTRYSAEAEQEFIDALKWVKIDFDEGPHIGGPSAPYHQSERKAKGIYAEHIQPLLDSGKAYKAFDTPEELEAMREFQQINKQPIGYYGGLWREATAAQVEEAITAGKPYVVRLKIPRDQTIVIEDFIRGRIEWDTNTVDDPVLLKADGMPTYHFAAMVDDHLMGITHIMRGEEWISSAPKHACLFDAFGWERPIFVHCPVIKGKDGKKLSKRHGATSVLDYRSMGYLPDAICNFIALIGWSPGENREILNRAELIEAFELSGLQPSSGVFDLEKLRWMNGSYIRSMTPEALLDTIVEYAEIPETNTFWQTVELEAGEPAPVQGDPHLVPAKLKRLTDAAKADRAYAVAAIALEQERVQVLADFGDACEFFFIDEPPMDPKAVEKWLTVPHARELFDLILSNLGPATVEHFEELLKRFQAEKEFEKLGPVVHPTRVALTGKTTGPGLYELMAVLGPDRIRQRLERAKLKMPA